jgi:Pseudouridylate synthases, 23S RNA-specific
MKKKQLFLIMTMIVPNCWALLSYMLPFSSSLHLDIGPLFPSRSSTGPLNCQQTSNDEKIKGSNETPKRERPRIPVLQYHNDWVCVNKPAGMTVHRGGSTPKNQLVLSTHLKRQLARKVFPVHRLDHRTSGAMLFAFNSETCRLLHKALTYIEEESCDTNYEQVESSLSSKKSYLALVRGDWKRKYREDEVVIVDKPLEVKGEMKEARTEFYLLASTPGNSSELYPPSACSLVLCIPKTGRTHQIRRHAFSMGFPVIGDNQHGDTKINKWWRENRGLSRLFLHCLSLDLPALSNFDAAKSGERIICTAPLSKELVHVLERDDMIELWTQAKEKDQRLSLEPFDEKGGTFGRNARKLNLIE